MTFYKDISALHGIHNQQTLFFSELLARMDGDQLVHLTPHVRLEIMKRIGSVSKEPLHQARQALNKLKNKNLITSCGGGTWMINPRLHGHSNLKEAIEKKEAIFLKIKYGKKEEREIYVGKLKEGLDYD